MESQEFSNWKKQVLAITSVSGIALGLFTGYLMIRSAEKHEGKPPELNPTDILGTAIAVIGVVRGIATLGDKK
jgi:hypothetical protein